MYHRNSLEQICISAIWKTLWKYQLGSEKVPSQKYHHKHLESDLEQLILIKILPSPIYLFFNYVWKHC